MRKNSVQASQSNGYKIIAVDDEMGIVDSLSIFLKRSGYDFTGVTNPLEAIERVKNEHFDLMILDFIMDPIHGDQVVEEIRKFNKELYILLLTGHKDLAPPLETIRKLDIQGYCEKSDKFDQLLLLIESGIKSIAQMNEIKRINEELSDTYEKLEKAYLLHRCYRYDLHGKEMLKTQEKFYLADTSLRYSVLGYQSDTVASSLENVVYLELCRRGYQVYIGKAGVYEIDFVAMRQNEKIYVQVAQRIDSEKTEKREYERLLEIPDNYPKYVLRTDEYAGGNYEGVKTMHVADFLLSKEY